jgi:hypothetical protein
MSTRILIWPYVSYAFFVYHNFIEIVPLNVCFGLVRHVEYTLLHGNLKENTQEIKFASSLLLDLLSVYGITALLWRVFPS